MYTYLCTIGYHKSARVAEKMALAIYVYIKYKATLFPMYVSYKIFNIDMFFVVVVSPGYLPVRLKAPLVLL